MACTLTHTSSRIVATPRMVLVSPCNSGTSMGTPTVISLRSIRLACRIQRWQWVAMGQRWKWTWPMVSTRAGAHADALRRGNQRDIEAAQRVSGPHSTEHQQLGCLNGTTRKQNLAAAAHAQRHPPDRLDSRFDSVGAPCLEEHTLNTGVQEDRQIGVRPLVKRVRRRASCAAYEHGACGVHSNGGLCPAGSARAGHRGVAELLPRICEDRRVFGAWGWLGELCLDSLKSSTNLVGTESKRLKDRRLGSPQHTTIDG